METLQGQFTDLSQYKGQVLLVINVATFCGMFFFFPDFSFLLSIIKTALLTSLQEPVTFSLTTKYVVPFFKTWHHK